MANTNEVEALLDAMAAQLRELIKSRGLEDPAMVGIHTGGVWVAKRLHQRLGLQVPLGSLDISFYRDDFTRIGMNPQVRPSDLPFDIDDRNIILVDDVLHTGRTIRAALNELFDYGRPATIVLAVLVERSGRELPIEANVVGRRMDLGPGEHVKLTGPEPLTLELQKPA
ncbi:MAG: bifunctional pyr operon transcriptional regulator/uracil phosphoribosyltransferase PyrR [Gammaproteobacteria bacterium]|jgi:pyrimidine operon attenuation protein/uracil phosphoribosyltransferase|nr:bifunctional pyr operon transcriptional regulator/uracil phosphoribosyltransferase PyrR [Gammaproteobacteria bacterium]